MATIKRGPRAGLLRFGPAVWLITLGGCGMSGETSQAVKSGGLLLPEGFEAIVVAESIGPARHITVNDNGDIYVKLRASSPEGSIVALRDTTGDGRADVIERFWPDEDRGNYHTGIKIHNGYLYFATNLGVYRSRLIPGELIPHPAVDTILIDDHERLLHQHQQKPLAFDERGHMYVPFGTPTDVCQELDRVPAVVGQEPCPDLEQHGGIWRFDADRLNQRQADGYRYATGIRSAGAIDWNPVDRELYVVIHGRDYLHTMWPNMYSPWHNAILPAEEFVRATEGSNFGWPFCYFDQLKGVKVLGPEYGGDGEVVGRCAEYDPPLIGFPGHFAPNGLMFYRGDQFPKHYRNGAFIAFHGSTIRNPYPQGGYFVGFVPFENGKPSGDWEVFANGFGVVDPIVSTGDAQHRPMGLATGPDGSLYIAESAQGKIWRVRFTGNREAFGPSNLARMKEEKRLANNIRNPDEKADRLQERLAIGGQAVYGNYCVGCHQRNGRGAAPRFPPLAGSEWVTGDKARLVQIILDGWHEPIEVDGFIYAERVMPKHGFLTDQEIADVATYIRQSFGNDADSVTMAEVREVRGRTSQDRE